MKLFVVVPPGIEALCLTELTELGVRGEQVEGGIEVEGDARDLMMISLHSRLASRVLVRLGFARTTNLASLAEGVRNLGWRRYVYPKQPVTVHASIHGRLHRRDVVERKVELAVTDALRRVPVRALARPPREPAGVWVRVEGDRAELSIDASGELMHRRGWGQNRTEAPLRENLAAAVLRGCGWLPGDTLLDPMCGSGTFLLEGATIVAGKAPGLRRAFAFERFPEHEPAAWEKLRRQVAPLGVKGRFIGSDIDGAAVQAARANADRAGVRIELSVGDVRDLQRPEGPPGWIVTNPPYGQRLAAGGAKRILADLGAVLRERFQGWGVAVLLPPNLLHAVKLPLTPVLRFSNGGVKVTCAAGRLG